MTIDPTIGVIVGSVLSAGGASWFGVKYTLNGTAKRVERIESKLDDALKDQEQIKIDVAVLKERVPDRRQHK